MIRHPVGDEMLRLDTFGGLTISGDAAATPKAVRPRRLALLAILAAAGPRGISRERVLAILWADSVPERARHSLAQALYSLRRELGTEVVVATTTLRLDASQITSDVEALRASIEERDWARVAALYCGPFLDDFYLAEAPEFERWMDEQRTLLSHDVARAMENAARDAAVQGDRGTVVEYWRRLTVLDPLDGRYAAACMDALAATGEFAAALLHGEFHAALVRRDLGNEPDTEVTRRLKDLRHRSAPRETVSPRDAFALHPELRPPSAAASVRPDVPIVAQAGTRGISRRRMSTLWMVSASILALVLLGSALQWRPDRLRGASAVTNPGSGAADSRSPVAERLFQEGLHAFYASDAADASRLFSASVAEDSSFVRAAYFAWQAAVAVNDPRQEALADRAAALAVNAPDRDRLLVRAHVLASRWDVAAIPMADSLLSRFPGDPEVLMLAASVTGDLARAVSLLERAIATDSARGGSSSAACRVCEAFGRLATRYDWADSAPAVERTLARWIAMRPADFTPWKFRAEYLIGLGRARAADDALRRADSLGAPRPQSSEAELVRRLRLDDLDAADDICRNQLRALEDESFPRFRWLCTIHLRMQGRYHDALGLARVGRVPWSGMVHRQAGVDRVNAALLDMEMGRGLSAARQFTQLRPEMSPSSLPRGLAARMIAWELTLSATAAAQEHDTVRVRLLADSVELMGNRSLFARDPLLHHFIRGVLLADAGAHEAAVREYRAALSSPSQGYTRINYELGKSLLALGRPGEAVAVLRAPLHGGLEGSGLYLTRTETHEMLAQAFAAAGERDSAAAHYAVVERSWRAADPQFAPRREAARQWLARAGRLRGS